MDATGAPPQAGSGRLNAALRAHVAGAPGRAARAALWLGHDAPTHPLEPEEEREMFGLQRDLLVGFALAERKR